MEQSFCFSLCDFGHHVVTLGEKTSIRYASTKRSTIERETISITMVVLLDKLNKGSKKLDE
jgi:hypothetical protein